MECPVCHNQLIKDSKGIRCLVCGFKLNRKSIFDKKERFYQQKG